MKYSAYKGSSGCNVNLSDNNLRNLKGMSYSDYNDLYLHLASNKLENIDELIDTTRLDSLYLYNNTNLKNIDGLSNLKRIAVLSLNNCFLKSVKPLANLEYVEYLSLVNNRLRDVEGLEGIRRITDLDLTDNVNLTDLSGLRNLVSIDTLTLNGNDLVTGDFDKLESLKLINYLVFKNQHSPNPNARYQIMHLLKTKKIPIQNQPTISVD